MQEARLGNLAQVMGRALARSGGRLSADLQHPGRGTGCVAPAVVLRSGFPLTRRLPAVAQRGMPFRAFPIPYGLYEIPEQLQTKPFRDGNPPLLSCLAALPARSVRPASSQPLSRLAASFSLVRLGCLCLCSLGMNDRPFLVGRLAMTILMERMRA